MSFWRGKRVLLTGGAGFIGSHTADLLVSLGSRVRIPVRPTTSLDFLADVKEQVEIVTADVKDADACRAVVKDQEVVLHLAAEVGGIQVNVARPAFMFKENLLGSLNMMEAAREARVERYLFTSTACVYPRTAVVPTPESEGFKDGPEPTNEGYGWAKRMGEYMAQVYAKEYGMKVAIARPYNAYGPRDDFDPATSHVIPSIIHRVLSGENPLRVWGDGTQSRVFFYAKDFAQGLLDVTERYAEGDPVNLGSDEVVTIKQLVELIFELTGKAPAIRFDPSGPTGQPRRQGDLSKAAARVGFTATTPLRDGLAKTIDWYLRHANLGRHPH